MDTPVPQIVEELIEVLKTFFQNRGQQRIGKQITETPAVSSAEEIVAAPKAKTQEEIICCLKETTSEFLEELLEVIQLIRQERTQKHTVEETEFAVPQVMKETIEAVKHVPQERVQSDTGEQIVAVPVPQIREETGQVIQRIPQDRIADRIGKGIRLSGKTEDCLTNLRFADDVLLFSTWFWESTQTKRKYSVTRTK